MRRRTHLAPGLCAIGQVSLSPTAGSERRIPARVRSGYPAAPGSRARTAAAVDTVSRRTQARLPLAPPCRSPPSQAKRVGGSAAVVSANGRVENEARAGPPGGCRVAQTRANNYKINRHQRKRLIMSADCARRCFKRHADTISFNLPIPHQPHFTDKESEVRMGDVNCPRLQSEWNSSQV